MLPVSAPLVPAAGPAIAVPAVGAPTAPAAASTVSNVFGLLVSGRPVTTEFAVIVPGEKFTISIPDPATAEFVSLFFLPGMSLPPDKGVTVMWSMGSFTEWTTLGVLTPSKPSATWRTGWPSIPGISAATHPAAMLGLAVGPVDAVASVGSALAAGEWDKQSFAELVAGDLVEYVSSFATVTPAGERVVMPPSAIAGWVKKFKDRFRHDPNFLYRRAGAIPTSGSA